VVFSCLVKVLIRNLACRQQVVWLLTVEKDSLMRLVWLMKYGAVHVHRCIMAWKDRIRFVHFVHGMW
jgi:hypothetical protein